MKRDFLTLGDLSREEHAWLLSRARWHKARRSEGALVETLRGKTLGLVFEKASTRTRVSFEAAMAQLGGHAIALPFSESQMARGEPLADTARVLSGYLDAIVMRTFSQERLRELAAHAGVPVINGLSDTAHPVQLLADLQTVIERLGSLERCVAAFIGDGGSNMALSWIEAASLFGFELRVASPEGYQPPPAYLALYPGKISVMDSPSRAAEGAMVVSTDVWTSMGQEAEAKARVSAFAGFTLDDGLLRGARPDAMVMHCLPAHRGEEIAASVIDGPRSAVWQQAENRMHAQKALLELLLLKARPEA